MNKSFREYCEEVISKLNELDVDNEFSFTVEDLINGDPFQELMSSEANSLRNEFYKNVQKYTSILPSKSSAKKDLAVYKAQLEFINARIAELDNRVELERAIDLDKWYLNHKDTYNEEIYSNKLEEDQSALEKAQIIYQDNLDLIASQFNSAKSSYDNALLELEPLEASYNNSHDNYIVALYANNMTKEDLEKIVKRAEYISSLETAYNIQKDPKIKEIIDKEKQDLADNSLNDYYKKAYENYDNLKGANLDILKAQMELDRLKLKEKKREVTKAKRQRDKVEKLVGLDLSKFNDKEALEKYRDELELSMINLSAINTVNKNNVQALTAAILKQEEMNLAKENRQEAPSLDHEHAENVSDKVDDVNQPEMSNDVSENKEPETDNQAEEKNDDEIIAEDIQNPTSISMNMKRFEVTRIENASKSLADKIVEKKGWLGKCVAAARIAKAKKAGLLSEEEIIALESARNNKEVYLKNNAEYWMIVKEIGARLDNKKVQDKLSESLNNANKELMDLETKYASGSEEEKNTLRLYNKIQDYPYSELERVRDEFNGDLRAYEAELIQGKIDEGLDRLTNNKWLEYQNEHPNETVLSTDVDTISSLGVTDPVAIKNVRLLLSSRNSLQLLVNKPKLEMISISNDGDKEANFNDEEFARLYNESMNIIKNEEIYHKTDNKMKLSPLSKTSPELYDKATNQMLKYSTIVLKNINVLEEDEELKMGKSTTMEEFENAFAIWNKVADIKVNLEENLDRKVGDSYNYEVNEIPGDQNVSSAGRKR